MGKKFSEYLIIFFNKNNPNANFKINECNLSERLTNFLLQARFVSAPG